MSGNVARLFHTEETWQQTVERYILTREIEELSPRTPITKFTDDSVLTVAVAD
ncbi:hypothetical protein [Aminobacterium mobile]|jgi:hypothetical protein|uniref:hypothetical protein n=1 Tax=Aminobacterium mobile TaxID=81467 RepID=UPI002FE2D927